mmetsp:Transcript_177823/g.432673  ORF Transcript_177823/g.432673 Transcript_177823/m.432673 type:complete len:230 (+) Transcript_177823:1199-1888(+)
MDKEPVGEVSAAVGPLAPPLAVCSAVFVAGAGVVHVKWLISNPLLKARPFCRRSSGGDGGVVGHLHGGRASPSGRGARCGGLRCGCLGGVGHCGRGHRGRRGRRGRRRGFCGRGVCGRGGCARRRGSEHGGGHPEVAAVLVETGPHVPVVPVQLLPVRAQRCLDVGAVTLEFRGEAVTVGDYPRLKPSIKEEHVALNVEEVSSRVGLDRPAAVEAAGSQRHPDFTVAPV